MPANTPPPHIERHDGEPITTLDDVRAPHNVVAAVGGLPAARKLIVELESAGIDPDRVSLLGAWPAEGRPVAPRRVLNQAGTGSMIGSLAGAAVTAILARSSGRIAALAGAVIGAGAGAMLGAARAMGASQAWRQSLIADGAGTVAVGVHSPDSAEVTLGEGIMRQSSPLVVNRFDGATRSSATAS
jgi:outer membrane lipoprotein SlyB